MSHDRRNIAHHARGQICILSDVTSEINVTSRGFLRPDCAPSLEPRNNADATFLDPHICRRLLMHADRHAASTAAARYDRREVAEMANAGIAIGVNFKIYLRQFCSNRVPIFYSARNCIASAVLATAIRSVSPSVCHTPVLCQNNGT